MAVVLVLVLAVLGGLVLLVGVRTLQPVLGDDAGVRVVYPHSQVVELPVGSSLEEVRLTCQSRRKMGGCMNWEHKNGGGGWGKKDPPPHPHTHGVIMATSTSLSHKQTTTTTKNQITTTTTTKT